MHTSRLARNRHLIVGWLVVAASTACAGKATPIATPRPTGNAPTRPGARLMPALWRSRVQFDRSDSIVLTLPAGATQVQRMTRRAVFTLTVGPESAVTVRLDSLTMSPAPEATAHSVVGTVWTGRMLGTRVVWRATAATDPVIEGLRLDLEGLFPSLPSGGVVAGTRWADTSTIRGRVDIFETSQRVVMKWTAGSDTTLAGTSVLPLRATGELEQSGTGSGAGVAMTMTGQGSRSVTYYMSKIGQIRLITKKDSMSVLISIPSSRQLVPTIRLIRSRASFSDNTP
jgi:hypothetical protein